MSSPELTRRLVTWTEAALTAGAERPGATGEGGSVLVFCGTKPNVRVTALVIAASRGQNIAGVHPDDIDRVHQLCAAAGVGLHYKDWEFKREAETRFRNREWDVLVATTTSRPG